MIRQIFRVREAFSFVPHLGFRIMDHCIYMVFFFLSLQSIFTSFTWFHSVISEGPKMGFMKRMTQDLEDTRVTTNGQQAALWTSLQGNPRGKLLWFWTSTWSGQCPTNWLRHFWAWVPGFWMRSGWTKVASQGISPQIRFQPWDLTHVSPLLCRGAEWTRGVQ